ncbi:MAG: ABC transporter permease subunit [Thermoproteota archaeon]
MKNEFRDKRPPLKRIIIIARKEFSDAVVSKRLWLLITIFLLYYLAMIFSLSFPYSMIPEEARPARITQVFSGAGSSVGLIAPFLGIAFGYDAVSRERESGTLRVLLSRPVYREDVVNGKIISSLAVIGVTLFTTISLTVSATMFLYGINIDLDDFIRLTLFSIFSLMFAFAYYSISLFLSTLLNKSGHSLIASIALWAFFTIIMPLISMMVAFMMLGMPSFTSFSPESDYWKKYVELNYMTQIFSINNHYSTLTGPVLAKASKQDSLDLLKLSSQYPISLVVLILYPTVFVILSYMVFTRREEK